MPEVVTPNLGQIDDDVDAIERAALDAMRGLAGVAHDVSGRTHISPLEYKRVKHFVRSFHVEMARKGYAFQFLEVFLSNVLFKSEEWKHRAVDDNSLFVSSVLRLNGKGYDHIDGNTRARFFRNHPSELTMARIDEKIEGLLESCQHYLFSTAVVEPNPEYEYFRYFCFRTFFAYLLEPERFQFGPLGISKFFKHIISAAAFAPFEFLRQHIFTDGTTIEGARKRTIEKFFMETLEAKIPESAEIERQLQWARDDSDRNKRLAAELVHITVKHIDALSLVIINNRRLMPLPCYTAFFGFATNRYPAWASSFTKAQYDDARPTWILPGAQIASELGRLNKSVHYTSYSNYLTTYGSSLIGADKQELGIMVIVPFAIGLDRFRKTGFVRAMRRLDPRSKQLITSDYEATFLTGDRRVLDRLARMIMAQFSKRLGQPNFFDAEGVVDDGV